MQDEVRLCSPPCAGPCDSACLSDSLPLRFSFGVRWRTLHETRLPPLQVNYLDGRKVKRRQQAPRWLDEFTVPGQFVAVRHEGSDLKQRLYALANSPYAARRESANLDASIVEVCSQQLCVVYQNHDKASVPAPLCTTLAPPSRAALLMVERATQQRRLLSKNMSLCYLVMLSHVLTRM